MNWLTFIWSVVLWCCVESQVIAKVKVNEGWLAGQKRNVSTGLGTLYSFQGIPYAEPPLGKLRFKAPVPHKGWKGLKNATQHGSICLQPDQTGSEDCLFLNVYTQTLRPEKPLPVVIFFHGGAWQSGSGNDDEYGPDFLVVHGVILVTVNYRLDALGYLDLNIKEVPGNAGMKDQNLAIKWVHNNIQHFGGNHNEITIMGHSCGGSSVIYHMMSPMSKGLFKRGIVMSGVPSCDWALPFESEKRAFQLGKTLGKYTNDPRELLEFLQGMPANELADQNAAVLTQEDTFRKIIKLFQFVPIVEKDFGQERFLHTSVQKALTEGNLEDIDLMIGYTDKENLFLLPEIEASFDLYKKYTESLLPLEIMYEIPPKDAVLLSESILQHYFGRKLVTEETMPELIRHQDDHIYIYHTNRLLKHLPDRKSNTFLYKFFSVTERNLFLGEKYGIRGCAHSDDYRYLFSDNRAVNVNSKEYRMINETSVLFTNFIKYGNPTYGSSLGVRWPAYDKEDKGYMIINETLAVGTNADAEIVNWWSNLFQSKGIELP